MRIHRFAAASLVVAALILSSCSGQDHEPGALVGAQEAQEMVAAGEAILVDVRSEESYLEAHLAGAINLPVQQVAGQANELASRGLTVITYCSCPAEETSSLAASELIAAGFRDVVVLRGGIQGWGAAGLPLRSGARP